MNHGQKTVLDIEEREKAADEFESWLRGGEGEGTPTEQFSDLSFSSLKQQAAAAGAELRANPFSIPLSMKATFLAACYRDITYAYRSRGHMLGLGANNALREYYEGIRAASDGGM